MSIYKIQSGDTLSKIARAHNTTVEELQRLNNIKDPNLIFAGSQLKLSEDAPQEPSTIPTRQEVTENHAKLDSLNRQVHEMREKMQNQETSSNSEFSFTRIGEVAAGVAAWEGAKWAAPKVAKATKEAGKAVANATQKATNEVATGTKNAANYMKKAMTKAGKNLKSAGKTLANATQKTAKKVASATKQAGKAVASATEDAGATAQIVLEDGKAGKLLGKAAIPVAVAVSAIEIHDAYKEEGKKGAMKQAAKTGTGLASAAVGAEAGAILGGLTGPAAPIAVPVLTLAGSIAGYIGGEEAVDAIINKIKK